MFLIRCMLCKIIPPFCGLSSQFLEGVFEAKKIFLNFHTVLIYLFFLLPLALLVLDPRNHCLIQSYKDLLLRLPERYDTISPPIFPRTPTEIRDVQVSFLGLQFYSTDLMPVFMPGPYCFDYCSFVVSFENLILRVCSDSETPITGRLFFLISNLLSANFKRNQHVQLLT